MGLWYITRAASTAWVLDASLLPSPICVWLALLFRNEAASVGSDLRDPLLTWSSLVRTMRLTTEEEADSTAETNDSDVMSSKAGSKPPKA